MSSNGMSTKENTLQLPPQLHSTSASESETETKINFGKYIYVFIDFKIIID